VKAYVFGESECCEHGEAQKGWELYYAGEGVRNFSCQARIDSEDELSNESVGKVLKR